MKHDTAVHTAAGTLGQMVPGCPACDAGECPNPRCILERHEVIKGVIWHQDINGRAWVTFTPDHK